MMCPACGEAVIERGGFYQIHGSVGEFCVLSGRMVPWMQEAVERRRKQHRPPLAPGAVNRLGRPKRDRQGRRVL